MSENPVKVAIKMEVDGMEFYRKAAESTKNPLGKKMFLSFVEDERKHLKALEMVFKGLDDDAFYRLFSDSSPRKNVETVFSRANEQIGEDDRKADADEINALETAMRMEKEGYDYYQEVARTSDDTEVVRLFKLLAIEENEHYTMLSNTHTYLVDTGNWFIWEEGAIIDGG